MKNFCYLNTIKFNGVELSEKTYRLEISSRTEELPKVEKFLEEICRNERTDEKVTTHLILAVNEAAVNAVIHGNKLDSSKKVAITVTVFPNYFNVAVKDEGIGFNPANIPDPTSPENLFKESGRGLFIMRSCIKEMNYEFTSNGTILYLRIDKSAQ